MNKLVIYMPLLGEGTDVWRPVEAERFSRGRYRVLGETPEDETWEFAPGSTVRCAHKVFSDGKRGLIAVCLDNAAPEIEVWRETELAAAVKRIKALPAFAIPQWWLTFYLVGAPDHLASVALSLRELGAQNTDGSEGGFLYPKLPVASEAHEVGEAISTVKRVVDLAGVELIGVDVDTSHEPTATRFEKLLGF